MSRRTIASQARLDGPGLHLGAPCVLTFRPAPPGTGIVFRRQDLPGAPLIPALVSEVTATERRTQLGTGAAAVHTVEHVLSAVGALGLDDLQIDMTGPEPPILDGSAAPFHDALTGAGVRTQGGDPCVLTLREPVRVLAGESAYEAYPSDVLELDVRIEFPHPLIGEQHGRWRLDGPADPAYRRELAAARTFGFVREVEMLRGRGLIQGASTANAIVLDDAGVVGNALRWADEFVRHKALDCVGDLVLTGARVHARIVAIRPSHEGTVALARELVRTGQRSAAVRSLTTTSPSPSATMSGSLSIDEIMKVLPHRYPFLLVDRIVEVQGRERIVGIKNVTINEPFFEGHFPGHPIMPGVLIIEAMAQVGGMLLLGTVPEPAQKVVYFMSLDNVRWRKPVRPGDQLRFELEVVKIRGPVCQMRGVAKVDGELVAEADMAAMVRDR